MDESRTARPHIAATLDHRHLVPPTLGHLGEHPGLASLLDAEVTTCLARRARFPHTLLVGPADSSKRAIIATVAAELDVPVTWTDAAAMNDARELDRTLRRAAPGSIVAIAGADDLDTDTWSELARIAATREPPRLRGYLALMHEMELEPWQRTPADRSRYAEFTFMLTSRRHVATTAASVRWVERQWFVPRSKETETVRLRRLLRAASTDPSPWARAIDTSALAVPMHPRRSRDGSRGATCCRNAGARRAATQRASAGVSASPHAAIRKRRREREAGGRCDDWGIRGRGYRRPGRARPPRMVVPPRWTPQARTGRAPGCPQSARRAGFPLIPG
ncbi:MAG: hypothetical protein ACKORL_00685, partial [Phycisphaerales bacterium]